MTTKKKYLDAGDWVKDLGVKYVFALELRPRNSFLVSNHDIEASANEFWSAIIETSTNFQLF